MSDELVPIAPVESAPVVEQVPSTTPEVETASTDAAPVSGEETPEAEKTFTQKELDEIIAKRIAKAERKAQRYADQRIAELLQQKQPEERQAPDAKPNIANFQTLPEFDAALDKWVDQQAEAKVQQKEAKAAEAKQREEFSRVQASFQEREDEAREKYADFDQKAYRTHYDCSPAMAEAIRIWETGPDLAYFFGDHPDEAARIAKLHPTIALREMGKLESKLSETPPARPTSSAPPPISPVKPKGSSPARSTLDPKSLQEMGTSAWIKAEEARMRKKYEAEHS